MLWTSHKAAYREMMMMIMMCEYDPGTFVESGGRIVIN